MKRNRFIMPARKSQTTFTATSADVTQLAHQLADASATLLLVAPDLDAPPENYEHTAAQARTIMALRDLTGVVRRFIRDTGLDDLPGPPERTV